MLALTCLLPTKTFYLHSTQAKHYWSMKLGLNLVPVYIFHQCSDLSLESSPKWLLTCSLVYPQFIIHYNHLHSFNPWGKQWCKSSYRNTPLHLQWCTKKDSTSLCQRTSSRRSLWGTGKFWWHITSCKNSSARPRRKCHYFTSAVTWQDIILRACAVWACVCMGQCKNGSFYQSVTLTVNFQHRKWCVSINAAWLVKMSELHELWAQQPCMLFDEICMTLAEL